MAKLVCPHCGALTSLSPVGLVGQGVLLDDSIPGMTLHKKVLLPALTESNYLSIPGDMYAILECQGCGQWFVASKERKRDDWSAVYPIAHRAVPEEVPNPIKTHFREARLCSAVGANVGCLVMCRTALIALLRERKASRLVDLKDGGVISDALYRQADEVRLWANIMAHEDVPEGVTGDDCEQLLLYLESLLDTIYVQPKRLDDLTLKRQQVKKGRVRRK